MRWTLPRPFWFAVGAVALLVAVVVGWAVGGPVWAARAAVGTLGVGMLAFAVAPVAWWTFVLVMFLWTISRDGINKPRFRPRTGPPPDESASPPPSHTPTP
jgi:hypothetical protein